MNNKSEVKVIKVNFKKDIDNEETLMKSKDALIVDLRKKNISEMVENLALLNRQEEDLLEG